MASGVPPLDVSVRDHRWDCQECVYRHQPGTACPAPGRWLASGTAVVAPRPAKEES